MVKISPIQCGPLFDSRNTVVKAYKTFYCFVEQYITSDKTIRRWSRMICAMSKFTKSIHNTKKASNRLTTNSYLFLASFFLKLRRFFFSFKEPLTIGQDWYDKLFVSSW